jgi:hypothetical protein
MRLYRSHLTEDRHATGDDLQLLQALLGPLESLHADQNPAQAKTLLDAISLLLDQMVYRQVKETDRVKIEALRRRFLPLLGGVSYLATLGLKVASSEILISGFEPDKLWEAYQCFKEIFAIGQPQCAPWYGELRFIDVLISLGRLDLVSPFLERPSGPRDTALLRGVCDRLERLACLQHDPIARDSALRLLKGLAERQLPWAQTAVVSGAARQILHRLAPMWPSPNVEVMARRDDAPPAWHPFWTARPSKALLTRLTEQQQARLIHAHQLRQMAQPSVTAVRQALSQHYQPTPDSLDSAGLGPAGFAGGLLY